MYVKYLDQFLAHRRHSVCDSYDSYSLRMTFFIHKVGPTHSTHAYTQ